MNNTSSPGPLRLWLVRHGVTDWNLQGRWQGHTDVPLGERGRHDALAVRPRLEHQVFDRVVSSDLTRATQTAQLAGFEPTLEPKLREVNFGRFEGGFSSVIRDDPAYLDWLEHPTERRWPGGESYQDVQHRVLDWINSLPLEANVLAFTHGGVISMLAANLLESTPFVAPRLWRFRATHASITVFERWQTPHGLAWTLERWNDTAHLE
jgi:broad specificity phosphatase PhoE